MVTALRDSPGGKNMNLFMISVNMINALTEIHMEYFLYYVGEGVKRCFPVDNS